MSNERKTISILRKCESLLVIIPALFTAAFLLKHFIPENFYAVYSTLGYACIAAVLVLYVLHLLCVRERRPAELILMTVYVLWLLVSRVLNSVYSSGGSVSAWLRGIMSGTAEAHFDLTLVLDIGLCLLIFSMGSFADARGRRRWLDIFSALYGAFAFVVSCAGIFVALTNTIIVLSPEYVSSYVNKSNLVLLSNNRNISAVWIYIGFCFMLYQFFACRKKLWRLPILPALLAETVVIALCHCRTILFASYMSAGMLAMLLVLRRMKGKKTGAVIPAVCAAAVAGLALSYVVLDGIPKLVARASEVTVPRYFEKYGDTQFVFGPVQIGVYTPEPEAKQDETADTMEAELKTDLTDKRDLLNDIRTFSRRTYLWQSVIPAIHDRPATLFIGNTRDQLMELPNYYAQLQTPVSRNHEHIHNYLLQTLLLSGIPGLLLVASISVLLILRMIRMFFDKSHGMDFGTKILVLPVSGLILYGLFEAYIFTAIDLRAVYFFLLAGMVLGEYRSAFSPDNIKSPEI